MPEIIRRSVLMASFSFLAFFYGQCSALASGHLDERERHHHEGYREVRVGDNKYYYDQGNFYTGNPGAYVSVEAPVGAVVEDLPSDCRQREGVYACHNTYYRRGDRGYEVIKRGDLDDRDEHRGLERDHDKAAREEREEERR